MFAQLGNHIFEGLKSPASWGATNTVKVGRVSRVNAKDAIQTTGAELEEISLTVQYSADFCVPSAEIDALKKSMISSEILPFVTGSGDILGKFIITSVDATNTLFTPTGILEAATISIKLLECPTSTSEGAKKPSGTALKSTAPAIQPPVPPVPSPAASIASDVAEAKNKVSQMKSTVTKVKKGMSTAKKGVRDVKKLAGEAKQLYTNAKTKVEVTKKIIQRASRLPTSLDGAISYAENLTKLNDTADISVLEMNVAAMTATTGKVDKAAAPVVAFSAAREGGK